MGKRTLLISLGALALSACAQYTYVPQTNATSQIRGQTAATYSLPSAVRPEGDLRVASFGVSKITKQNGEQFRAMHVRMVVSNNGSQPWVLDTREQLIDLRGFGQARAAAGYSEGQDLPLLSIAPGQKRTVDLFFPLPPEAARASRVPEFDVVWKIQAGGQQVAQRTPFERLQVEPLYAGVGWGYPYYGAYGFGPYLWTDPFWGPGVIASPAWYW
jgi:hypothetical protein